MPPNQTTWNYQTNLLVIAHRPQNPLPSSLFFLLRKYLLGGDLTDCHRWGIGATMCALMAKATLPGDVALKTCEDATFVYPSGEKIVVPQTFAHFLGDDEDPTPAGQYAKYRMFARFDVELRCTVATLMARDLDLRGTLDLLYLTVTRQIEEGDRKARQRQVPAWETDAGLEKFVDDHLRNAPVRMFPAGQALEEPTPPPPPPPPQNRAAAAGTRFWDIY